MGFECGRAGSSSVCCCEVGRGEVVVVLVGSGAADILGTEGVSSQAESERSRFITLQQSIIM